MVEGATITLLESFASGRIDIVDFEQRVRDRLFELRQHSAMSEEKRLLSGIQLCLHEAQEGNRDLIEVYIVSQSALDLVRPTMANAPNVVERLDSSRYITPGTDNQAQDSRPPSLLKLQPV